MRTAPSVKVGDGEGDEWGPPLGSGPLGLPGKEEEEEGWGCGGPTSERACG